MDPKFLRTKHVMLGKHTLEVYSIGYLAAATDLAKVTLRLWERKRILPKPILQLPGGVRYYTALEVLKYASLVVGHYTSGRDLPLLQQLLQSKAIQIKELLRDYMNSPDIPVEVTRLHLKPKTKWNLD